MINRLPGLAVEGPGNARGPHEAYTALLDQRILGFQACTECSAALFPPRGRCARCGGSLLVWRASAGRGTIYSSTVLSPRGEHPYSVVLVDLDEGYRMMSRVDDSSIAIADRVEVNLVVRENETLPFFTRSGDSNAQ